jgi:hypothetical protein
MADEKRYAEKRYEVEWSLDFGKLGEQVSRAFSEGLEVKQEQFETERGAAQEGTVTLNLAVGQTSVTALAADDARLMHADVTHMSAIEFIVAGDDANKQVTLRQAGGGATSIGDGLKLLLSRLTNANSAPQLKWQIGLTRAIPLTLEVDSGVGEGHYDLRDVQLRALKFNGGVGANELHLPASSAAYSANVINGVGQTRLFVPTKSRLSLHLQGGVGQTVINIAHSAEVELHIEGGVGQVLLEVPPSASVRLVASSGLGAVELPTRYAHVGNDGDQHIYETSDVSDTSTMINVHYRGGVGALTVHDAQIV